MNLASVGSNTFKLRSAIIQKSIHVIGFTGTLGGLDKKTISESLPRVFTFCMPTPRGIYDFEIDDMIDPS